MNKLIVIVLLVIKFDIEGQDILPLKERVEANLKLATNDYLLSSRVQVDNTGIVLYDSVGSSNVVASLNWSEVPKFLEIVENWDYYSMVEAFESKGQIAFAQADVSKMDLKYQELPSSWAGLVV